MGLPAEVHANNFWLRGGALHMGNPETPHDSKINIVLHGGTDKHFNDTILEGNKGFIVTGEANIHGAKRDHGGKITETLYPTEKTINFEPGLDWEAGEMLALTGTNVNPEASETLVIESYDPISGKLTLVEPIEHYHYGARASTADDFGGLDMRSELVLLSRDITIEADTSFE